LTANYLLDRKGSFDIGLKFARSVGSRPDFLIKGCTTLCLKCLDPWGKTTI